MQTVEERVSKLEHVLEEFIKAIGIEFNKLYNSQMRTEEGLQKLEESFARQSEALRISQMKTEEELREFKEEMRLFREESERDRKALHEEMREFKEEMKAFREEMREENKRMNKKWGEISNKLGTIVEDIIYPALRPVIRQYFNCDPLHMAMNIERKKAGLKGEFDAIVECEDMVFLVEVKSTPRTDYIDDFKDDKVERFKKLFPEYSNKRLILIFASLRLEEKTVEYLTQNRIYAMAYREWEYMDILNFDAFQSISS
ncbi:MAG: hypothetical protein ACK4TF_02435 [Thermodesulfovibrionales bacterium]